MSEDIYCEDCIDDTTATQYYELFLEDPVDGITPQAPPVVWTRDFFEILEDEEAAENATTTPLPLKHGEICEDCWMERGVPITTEMRQCEH